MVPPADVPPPSVGDMWLALRDRLLGSWRFQRFATHFWPTRVIARRRARQMFDLVAGFVYSQVLLACVRLHLFELLAQGPLDLQTIAQKTSLREDAALRLLAAAESLQLVQRRRNGHYGLGPLGAPLAGNPGVRALVEHHSALYADLADPVALLRGEPASRPALSRYWPYAVTSSPQSLSPDCVVAYSALMSASQPLVADEVLDAYSMRRHKCLLDVGGGEGVFLSTVAARAPHLKLVLFDLPAVADLARRRVAESGLADRTRVIGGSFLTDALPGGADIISLVRVVHDHDDANVRILLRAAHDALPPGGTLLLAEPMAGTKGAEPAGDAYFGFYLMAMGSGRPRTPEALSALITEAGFEAPRLIDTAMPLQTRLLVARRPKRTQVKRGVNSS